MTRHAFACLPALLAATLCAPLSAQVNWLTDLDAACAAAKDKPSKAVLLYCWQDNHDTCAAMFSGTMSDKKIEALLADFACLSVKRDDDEGKKLQERYGITVMPTVIFVDPEAKVLDWLPGYSTIDQFGKDLQRIKDGKQTIPALRQRFAEEPSDMQAAMMLVQKLRLAGDLAGSHVVIEKMIAVDPKAKSEEAAEAMLWKINDETFKPGTAPADVDLTELRRFLSKQRNKRIKFLGYDRMATAEYQRDDLKAAAKAAMQAWKAIPDDRVIEWGQRMSRIAYQRWKELDETNKRLLKDALKISKA
ncbi:MAG: hypothetical protein KAI24_09755, partial [Planctomycetes bacterium]|nr:hypothetical protein [Planctomycetota bacterium]